MRARLIVHETQTLVIHEKPGMTSATLWPADKPIPEGWEEVEIVMPLREVEAPAQEILTGKKES